MGAKDVLDRAKFQGRTLARRGLEKVSDDVMNPSSSVQDRVVSNPDGEEIEPKKPESKPIVSINGHDVDERAA